MHLRRIRRGPTAALLLVLVAPMAWCGCGEFESFVANLSLAVTGRTTKPYVQMDAPDSVVVAWFTPQEMVGEIEVIDLSDPDGASRRIQESEPAEHHEIRVADLHPDREYAYRLIGPAATDEGTHRLPAPKRPNERVAFAVVGDSGSGSAAQHAVAARIEAAEPDYIVHTGDVVYPRGADADYDATFFEPYADILTHVPIFPSLGNHDVGFFSGDGYLRNFVLPRNGPEGPVPERSYSIELGDVLLVSVDRSADPITTHQTILPWLRETLGASDAVWKLVVFHYPLYNSGTPTRAIPVGDIAVWSPIFDEFGVDLSLTGHNHFYERSVPLRDGVEVEPGRGTVYLVSGNGGRSLYTLAPRAPFSAASNDQTFGFALVEIEDRRIEISHIDDSGNVLDNAAWEKPE